MRKAVLLLIVIINGILPLKAFAQEAFNYNFFLFLLNENAYSSAETYLSFYPKTDSILYCEQRLQLKSKHNSPSRNSDFVSIIDSNSLLKNKTAALQFYNQHVKAFRNYSDINIINEKYIRFYQASIAAYEENYEAFIACWIEHFTKDTANTNVYLDDSWNSLFEAVTRHMNAKHKNKFFATGLSIIVPGLGKAYLGKPRQALSTFTGIAFLGLETWEAFEKGGFRSPLFITFGGIGTLFYLGNIYGTYLLNKASASKQKEHYHEEIMAIMGPRLVE